MTMASQPLVSVVTPVYNGEKHLEECIEDNDLSLSAIIPNIQNHIQTRVKEYLGNQTMQRDIIEMSLRIANVLGVKIMKDTTKEKVLKIERQIPIYLFLGGLAAGLLFFAAYFYLQGKEDKYPTTVKIAPFIAPFAIVLGLVALLLDLKHKLYFWKLYTTIRLESPMGWGAWTLMIITPLSLFWSASYMKELQQHLRQKGLGPYILFTGYCSEIKNVMASVHAVVSFSRTPESFGRSVLEALSLGVPVAGFDSGGVGELLREMFPLGLIKEDDMDGAVAVLRHIYETRPLPFRNNTFTLERMVTQSVQLYMELLRSPRHTP